MCAIEMKELTPKRIVSGAESLYHRSGEGQKGRSRLPAESLPKITPARSRTG